MSSDPTVPTGEPLDERPAVSPTSFAGQRTGGMFRALRHRNYRLFAIGQCISLTGTWTQTVAESWLVYRLTNSAHLLGLTAFATLIPGFILSPLGGLAADRYNRRTILFVTQATAMVLAFLLAVLTLTGVVQVEHILVLGALLGVVNAFDIPARQSFVVQMVGPEDMMNAIGINSTIFNSTRIIGPALAGLLLSAVGEGWCFFLNSMSYLAVLYGLSQLELPPHTRPATAGSAIEQVREGFRFAFKTPPIRALLLLLAAMNIMGTQYSVLMPVFAQDILKVGSGGLGLLMSAAGIGALGGALLITRRKRAEGLGRAIAVACMSLGVTLTIFAASRSYGVSVLALIPVGLATMFQMAASNTLVQSMVPDMLRGRVMAVYSMIFLGMGPIGSLMAGVIAERLGAPATVAIGGMGCFVAGAVFRASLPRLREEARALLAASESARARAEEHITVPTAAPSGSLNRPPDKVPLTGHEPSAQ